MVRKMYLMLLAAPLALAACSDRSQTSCLSARPSMSQQALATSQQALQTAQQAQATANEAMTQIQGAPQRGRR